MTLPEKREYFNSPSVYRGSTPRGGREFEKCFLIHLFLILTTPSNSPLHRGRTYYIETLRRFLAFVSPPVQGGAKGGSLFHFQFSIFNCSSSSSIVPTSITFSPSRQIRKPEVVKSPVSTHTLDSTFRFAKMPLRCNALRTMAYF